MAAWCCAAIYLLGLLALLNGIKGRSAFQLGLAGLCLSLVVLSRPTAALFAILLSLLILLAHKDSLMQSLKASMYLSLGVVPALLFSFGITRSILSGLRIKDTWGSYSAVGSRHFLKDS